MAALGPPSPPMSPSMSRKGKSCARKCERSCCNIVRYLPVVIIYALTTWAVWVEATIGFLPMKNTWTGHTSAFVGIALYILLNWSYTTAVFTDPGSPLNNMNAYSSLPNQESPTPSLTVKSTGETRFCKKCHTRKPDRAHHCSTCRRCVMKMDHHCPWLATCVGLRNYKPFILFLVYTCLFCYICFASSATWVWREILDDVRPVEDMMPVNYILLAVISGIIGLVLGGFTGWHLYLATKGRTTIESLEQTRYLAPMRKSMQQQFSARHHSDNDNNNSRATIGDQLLEIHANALPGVTRPEEGEEDRMDSSISSPAQNSLRRSYAEMEHSRERDRYQEYLSEQETEKLPNAFDLGWRRNLQHVFGKIPWLWFLPICNTIGDGSTWEINPKWLEANAAMAREREARRRENEAFDNERGWAGRLDYSNGSRASPTPPTHTYTQTQPPHHRTAPPTRSPLSKPLSTVPSSEDEYASSSSSSDHEDDNNDTFVDGRNPLLLRNMRGGVDGSRGHKAATTKQGQMQTQGQKQNQTANWNDLPDEFLKPTTALSSSSAGAMMALGVGRGRGRGGPRPRSPNVRYSGV